MRFRLLGERRAIALLALGFCTFLFAVVALAVGGEWAKCFYALAAVYGVGFFGLGAEWFWARWYVMGLGLSGVTMAALGLLTAGWNAGIAIWGGVHLLIYAPLLGGSMADRYENQEAWRSRYRLDAYGVERIERAVKGAATALPTLIFFTLAPRQGAAASVLLLAGAGLGLWGLLRLRFWGVALLGLTAIGTGLLAMRAAEGWVPPAGVLWPGLGGLAALALLVSVAPFVGPAYRFLRRAND